MDVGQIGVLLVGWVVAFLLGKELQAGFVQWREGDVAGSKPKGFATRASYWPPCLLP